MKKMRTMVRTMVMMIMMAMMVMMFSSTSNAQLVAKEGRLSVYQGKYGTKVKWMGKTIRWYDFYGKVRIISERKLTYKMLTRRKNKVLYIERTIGKVVNDRLDGKTALGYISYKNLQGKVKKGDTVISYFVYSPYTHWIDDYDERYDVFVNIKRKAR